MFLIFLIFPLSLFGNDFEIKQINNSDVTIKNEVYTNTGGEGRSYSRSETVINGERTVVESSEPGSIKVEIQQDDNSSPTVVIKRTKGMEVNVQKDKVPPKIIKSKISPILNFWQSFIIQLRKIFNY